MPEEEPQQEEAPPPSSAATLVLIAILGVVFLGMLGFFYFYLFGPKKAETKNAQVAQTQKTDESKTKIADTKAENKDKKTADAKSDAKAADKTGATTTKPATEKPAPPVVADSGTKKLTPAPPPPAPPAPPSKKTAEMADIGKPPAPKPAPLPEPVTPKPEPTPVPVKPEPKPEPPKPVVVANNTPKETSPPSGNKPVDDDKDEKMLLTSNEPVSEVKPDSKEGSALVQDALARIDEAPADLYSDKAKAKVREGLKGAHRIFKVDTIHFDKGGDLIPAPAKAHVNKALQDAALQDATNDPRAVFFVLGFADKSGSPETNKKLSLSRANTVINLLRNDCGVINLTYPVAIGSTEIVSPENQEKNRAAEVWLVIP